MADRDERKSGDGEPAPRRSREEVLRDIKMALAIDGGLTLEERRRKSRGFDPYDSGLGAGRSDPWNRRRRG